MRTLLLLLLLPTAAGADTIRARVVDENGLPAPGPAMVTAPAKPGGVRLPFPAERSPRIGGMPGIALVGGVVDDGGGRGAGVRVTLFLTRGGIPSHPVDRTTTDRGGCYPFLVIDIHAEYRAGFRPGQVLRLRGGCPDRDDGAGHRFTDLVIASADSAVEGRVLNAHREPVGGAVVYWTVGTSRHRTTTDREGGFRLEGLPARPVVLGTHTEQGAAFAVAVPGRKVEMLLTEANATGRP